LRNFGVLAQTTAMVIDDFTEPSRAWNDTKRWTKD
jgi:hypothetical protein